jgi:hypothetical protein
MARLSRNHVITILICYTAGATLGAKSVLAWNARFMVARGRILLDGQEVAA